MVKFERPGAGWPPVIHLSIKAHDKRCVHDWRDMQRIKNEIVGVESEAMELYPAESRLMDEANQFHLFCLHPAVGPLPFGQKERTHLTQEELKEMHPQMTEEEMPQQRDFEDHHGVRGVREGGLVEWPSWAVERMEEMGVKIVGVKSSGELCKE